MPGLLTADMDALVYTVLSLGLLVFAVLAILNNRTDSSIFCFLMASIFLAGILVRVGNSSLGIVVLIMYLSLCTVLLVTSRLSEKTRHTSLKKRMLCCGSIMMTSFLLLYNKLDVNHAHITDLTNYAGISGITLSMCGIFMLIIVGLSFLRDISAKPRR